MKSGNSLEIGQLNIVEYSGNTILREKPHGRKRTLYAGIILISSGT
jgi:hypothetical protein